MIAAKSTKAAVLDATVAAMLAPGRGLLAADESFPTIGRRFDALKIPSTAENRRAYRELLFTTPGLRQAVSGVILFDETLRQRTARGVAFPQFLSRHGMVPGIKVDGGTVELAGLPGEKVTQGLDGLRERLAEYWTLGARFTKWRAVIAIGRGLPTAASIEANAEMEGLFAALSQEAGLVPIVEPEVLMDGNHTIERCEAVTTLVLETVFAALARHRVCLERMVLKTGMVLSGEACPRQAPVAAVAAATVRCLLRSVPAAVPGIVFLSGGQGDVEATARLNAIARIAPVPWRVTFSYGRALQAPAMNAWRGAPARVPAAQAALAHRARCNGLAVRGKYSAAAERGR